MIRTEKNRDVVLLALIMLAVGFLPGCDMFTKKKTDAPLPERDLRHVNLGRTFDQPAVTLAGPVKDERFDDMELTELMARDRVGQLYPLDVSFGRNEFGPWLRISTTAEKAYKELAISANIRYQRKNYKLSALFEKQKDSKVWSRKTVTLK